MGACNRLWMGFVAATLALPLGGSTAAADDRGVIAFIRPEPGVHPAFAPDDVWLVEPNGANVRRAFASVTEAHSHPQFSPDGQWIAVRRGREYLVVARPDGSDARVIARRMWGRVTWSPDGTRLIYETSTGNAERSHFHMVNADGSDDHRIYTGPWIDWPSWSPRGDALVFSQEGPGADFNDNDPEIAKLDLHTGETTMLTDNFENGEHARVEDFMPAWSPNAERIAFVSSRDGGPDCHHCPYDLYTMAADGTDVQRFPREGDELFPEWSPDGSEIAFVSIPVNYPMDGYRVPIRAVNVNSGATRVITMADDSDTEFDWGPEAGTVPRADLRATFTLDPASTLVGGSFGMTASITNDGPGVARGAALELRLPEEGVTPTTPPGCSSGAVLRCPVGDLSEGESRSVSFSVSGDVAGIHLVSVMATSVTPDPDVFDNRREASLAVCTAHGSSGSDVLVGTTGDDVLCGGAGDDQLVGGDGEDVLVGGPGEDRLAGGNGADTASYATALRPVVVDLAAHRARGVGTDRLSDVENAVGSRFADKLVGAGSANVLTGGYGRDRLFGRGGADVLLGGGDGDRLDPGPGRDHLDGGLGVDTVDYGPASRAVRADLRKRRAKAEGRDGLYLMERVQGSRFSDWMRGNLISNRLVGGGGSDVFDAAGGNDTVSGGRGRDRLAGGDGRDRLFGGAGFDTCRQDFGSGPKRACER